MVLTVNDVDIPRVAKEQSIPPLGIGVEF